MLRYTIHQYKYNKNRQVPSLILVPPKYLHDAVVAHAFEHGWSALGAEDGDRTEHSLEVIDIRLLLLVDGGLGLA